MKRVLVLFLVLTLLITFFEADSFVPIKIVSEKGDQAKGITVKCPEGYVISGGGFFDGTGLNDDQDWNNPLSKPKGEGWYCKEDQSVENGEVHDDSECYALCISDKIVKTKVKYITGQQNDGVFVDCKKDIMLGGGFGNEFRNNDDQDYAHPKNNGFYCEESRSGIEARCYAVCAEPKLDYGLTCETVIAKGDQNNGVFVECPSGTFVTGGGFGDGDDLDEDQDASYPLNNGWFCKDYLSTSNAECYARCCSLEMECWDNDGDGYEDTICGGDDCDDSNPVVNPGRPENCENGIDDDCDGLIDFEDDDCEVVGCLKNLDCGSSYYGDRYCQGFGVYMEHIFPECNNKICSSRVEIEFIETCNYGCSNGICLPQPVDCVIDADCGVPHYGNNYCQGDSVVRDYLVPKCIGLKCSLNKTTELVEKCDEDCKNGKCVDDCEDRCSKDSGYIKLFSECVPNWRCSGWSECTNEVITRVCEDFNRCENPINKPLEKTSCQVSILEQSFIEEKIEISWFWIMVVLGLVSFLILLWLLSN